MKNEAELQLEYQALLNESGLKTVNKSRYAQFKKQYQNDRVGFVHDCFDWSKTANKTHPDGQKPAEYQDDIVGRMDLCNRQAVRGPHGLGKCVRSDEIIELRDGSLVRAELLVNKKFRVTSVGGDLRRRSSLAFAVDNGERDVIEVTTDKGRVFTRTLEHPVWGDLTPRRWYGRLRPEGSWVDCGDLELGAVVAVRLGQDGPRDNLYSDDDIKLCAYMIADGCLSSGDVRYAKGEGPYVQELREISGRMSCDFHQINNQVYGWAITGVDGGQNYVLTKLRAWGLMGKTAHSKKFPSWVWNLDTQQLSLFLSRLFPSDGGVGLGIYEDERRSNNTAINREISYCTVSHKLAKDMHWALLRVGIQARLCKRKTGYRDDHGRLHRFYAYVVSIHDTRNIVAFAKQVGMYGKEKKLVELVKNVSECSKKEQQKWRLFGLPEGYVWEKVKKVKVIDRQPTICITVPGDQTFLTQFVEHNSTVAGWLLHHFSLTMDGEDWKCPTTASVWRQLMKYLWPEVHKWSRLIKWDYVGREPYDRNRELMQLNLKLDTGEAMALASDQPESLEGCHADNLFFVFDEAKTVPDATWDAIEGAFSTPGIIKVFAMSTPGSPSGRFYDIHKRAPGYEDWYVRHVTIDEAIKAGRVSPEWVAQRVRQWGRDSSIFKNRVLGQFASDDETGVIPLDWVERAVEYWKELVEASGVLDPAELDDVLSGHEQLTQCQADEIFGPFTRLSVDVARGGGDSVVHAVGHGVDFVSRLDYKSNSIDSMKTTGEVVSFMRDRSGEVIMDVGGLGAVVFDRVRELGVNIVAFNSSRKSIARDNSGELEFFNERAEAWWKMRERLDPNSGLRTALPPDKMMIGDLTAPKWTLTSNGKVLVESKEDIRKRIGRSPDGGDGVVMRFFNSELLEVNFY